MSVAPDLASWPERSTARGLEAEPDEALMKRYQGGDMRAFDALFARYAQRLHAFFVRYVHSPALADDLLQATLLRVHTSRASYDSTLPLKPWLFRIAARVRIDALRQRTHPLHRADDAGLETVSAEAATRPDARAAARQKESRVRAAIDALPEPQRLVVILHRFEGLSFAEIAPIVSEAEGSTVTEVAVRVRAFRAMAVLRRSLADLLEEDAS